MILLAFDQATAVSGFACFKDEEMTDYGTISYKKTKEGLDTPARVLTMIAKIGDLIEDTRPDEVVIEEVAMQKDAHALIMLARVQGGILGICNKLNIPCAILPPTVWRKLLNFAQGRNVKRPMLKQQAKALVMHLFKIKVVEDEADAICIGLARIQQIKLQKEKDDQHGSET